jgi:hypothetical protein
MSFSGVLSFMEEEAIEVAGVIEVSDVGSEGVFVMSEKETFFGIGE